jgi:hypothetical protein
MYFFFFLVAQHRNSGWGRYILEISRSHTHPVDLWTSDQLVAEAAAYTTRNEYTRRTSISSAGFEPAIPAIKRLLIYVLDSMATGIDTCSFESDYREFLSGIKNYSGSDFPNVLIRFIDQFYVPRSGSIIYLRQNLYSRAAIVGP